MGVAAGPWAGLKLQGRGRGCRAVGVAAGPWACEKDVHSLYHFREDPFCQWYAVVFGHW